MITDELISEKNGRKTIPHEAGRKNELTRQNVLRCAFAEFAQRGFDAGSVNAICQNGNISKGIIYYYFSSKEDLYLSCVEKCFQDLTDYLSARLQETEAATAQDLLTAYFDLRMIWFRNHPDAASLFCSAVMTPPASLKEKILSKNPFWIISMQKSCARFCTEKRFSLIWTVKKLSESSRSFRTFLTQESEPCRMHPLIWSNTKVPAERHCIFFCMEF